MAQIKFFRGSEESSIPTTKRDGSIYVIQRKGKNTGDIYVDMSDSQRIKIKSDDTLEIKTTAEWHANNFDSTNISIKDKIYVYSDYQTTIKNNKTVNIPGYKIGDGLAYIIDLPTNIALTAEKEVFWNNKVDAFIQTDSEGHETENLILSYGTPTWN